MAKFATRTNRSAAQSPLATTTPTATYEGGQAWSRDAKSDLFLLAAVNMVGEDTFYEGKSDRDGRFRGLVTQVTREDPDWVARFVPFLRSEMHMRSASVVMAAESAHARKAGTDVAATVSVRRMIADALQRADEPAEFLAYWRSRFGHWPSGGVLRGVADAVTRLTNERAAVKYDGTASAWRLGDVVETVHPTPAGPWQADLFAYLLDRRHHPDEVRASLDQLPIITAWRRAQAMPAEERRAYFLADPARLGEAGMTWEALSGLGPMDRPAWEAVIPHMGYMALLRNLRNFDQVSVSDEMAAQVAARLADPEQVARSRQLPFRFLSAYRAAPSLRWGHALERALDASLANVPELPGRTLVLLDESGSMVGPLSARSTVLRTDAAAVFGFSLARRSLGRVDLYGFSSALRPLSVTTGGSVLRDVDGFARSLQGGGTETCAAVIATYAGHDRVVILTDEQAFGAFAGSWFSPDRKTVSDAVPAHVPMFSVNLAGYAPSMLDLSEPNRYAIGGFSDRLFTMLGILSQGRSTNWPF